MIPPATLRALHLGLPILLSLGLSHHDGHAPEIKKGPLSTLL